MSNSLISEPNFHALTLLLACLNFFKWSKDQTFWIWVEFCGGGKQIAPILRLFDTVAMQHMTPLQTERPEAILLAFLDQDKLDTTLWQSLETHPKKAILLDILTNFTQKPYRSALIKSVDNFFAYLARPLMQNPPMFLLNQPDETTAHTSSINPDVGGLDTSFFHDDSGLDTSFFHDSAEQNSTFVQEEGKEAHGIRFINIDKRPQQPLPSAPQRPIVPKIATTKAATHQQNRRAPAVETHKKNSTRPTKQTRQPARASTQFFVAKPDQVSPRWSMLLQERARVRQDIQKRDEQACRYAKKT